MQKVLSKIFFLLAVATFSSFPYLALAQRTFGLVIGVNKYEHVNKLDGAVADANDIAGALRRNGADRLVTLIDGDATKAKLVDAWKQLLAEAEPGDTIVFSYAGHGAQAPEQIAGDEEDKLDEFWVLPGFNPDDIANTWKETVFDNELNEWFTTASKKGVNVTFISDSCHSGGMDRSIRAKVRSVDLSHKRSIGDLVKLVFGGGESNAAASKLPENVTMLAATSEDMQVPELVIDGRLRGALSWSVARAFEGPADTNHDGVITRSELENYVLPTVRQRSDALQIPVFTPVSGSIADQIILAVKTSINSQAASFPDVQTGKSARPTARELGFTGILPLEIEGDAIRPADTIKAAYPYVWDVQARTFEDPQGQVVAEGVDAQTVEPIVQKFIFLDYLSRLAQLHTGSAAINPARQVYLEKDRLRFAYGSNAYDNFMVFDLANNGEIMPIDLQTHGKPAFRTPLKMMEVTAPFGADHLVVIASPKPLDSVFAMVKAGVPPKVLRKAIEIQLEGENPEVTIIPIHTRSDPN